MGNPEILAILGTQDTERRQTKQNKTHKTKIMSNTDPSKIVSVPSARIMYSNYRGCTPCSNNVLKLSWVYPVLE